MWDWIYGFDATVRAVQVYWTDFRERTLLAEELGGILSTIVPLDDFADVLVIRAVIQFDPNVSITSEADLVWFYRFSPELKIDLVATVMNPPHPPSRERFIGNFDASPTVCSACTQCLDDIEPGEPSLGRLVNAGVLCGQNCTTCAESTTLKQQGCQIAEKIRDQALQTATLKVINRTPHLLTWAR